MGVMKRLRSNDEETLGKLVRSAERHGLTVRAFAPYSEWECWHISDGGKLLLAYYHRQRRAYGLFSRRQRDGIDSPNTLIKMAFAEIKLIGKPTPAQRRERRQSDRRNNAGSIQPRPMIDDGERISVGK